VGGGGLGLWCLQIAKAVLPSTTKVVVADIAVIHFDFFLICSIAFQHTCFQKTALHLQQLRSKAAPHSLIVDLFVYTDFLGLIAKPNPKQCLKRVNKRHLYCHYHTATLRKTSMFHFARFVFLLHK